MTGPYGVISTLDLWLMAEWLHENFVYLNERMKEMTDVVVQQEDLDALAEELATAASTLSEQIAALEAAAADPAQPVELPAGSLDGIKTAVSTLQGLETPAPAPAPAETPAAPAAPPVDQAAPPA